ncbi:hypothetical protein GCM10010974_20010 [Brevibacterium sediminis]|uniref:Uncharacterized protein n=1 Tax=Brevibacterium sediminis TaxID=1857024 RepID=A0ABQ1MHL8_9MICO|nr:hypothetical protein GCM10010974_20010 [Brevibacterium sediminis]
MATLIVVSDGGGTLAEAAPPSPFPASSNPGMVQTYRTARSQNPRNPRESAAWVRFRADLILTGDTCGAHFTPAYDVPAHTGSLTFES